MAEKAIIYITDNFIDSVLAENCRKKLLDAAGDIEIICVTQEPLSFGNISITVGKLPRSIASITRQILTGIKCTNAKWIFIAEHDCLYCQEHFQFLPSDDDFFWYNQNLWLVQHKNINYPEYDGMYSKKFDIYLQSQMVGDRDLMKEAQEERLSIVENPEWISRYPLGRLGEPGAASLEKAMKLSNHESLKFLKPKLKSYCTRWKAKTFSTKYPNIDIRHGGNFTGQLRGKKRVWSLEPWGKWDSVFS